MTNTQNIAELVTYELQACGPLSTASLAAAVEYNYTGDKDVDAVLPAVLADMEANFKVEVYDGMEGVWDWTTSRMQVHTPVN